MLPVADLRANGDTTIYKVPALATIVPARKKLLKISLALNPAWRSRKKPPEGLPWEFTGGISSISRYPR
jgi:hypothetical protein